MGGFAWVTLATNDSYSLGALVLAHSLRRAGTKHDLAVLITPGVTQVMRDKLATVFSLVQEVNVLDSKDEANLALLARPELGITFTKLHCWRLTQYEKCVFIDADALVIRNCDELFEREELSAAPDVGWPDCFNSGVFVFQPSQQTFASLTAFAVDKGSFDGGDQGLLNSYFSDWAHKDISKHLPFIYNMCSTATYSYLPAYKQFGENARIIHFIGATKPWLQYFDTETGIVHPPSGSNYLQPLLQLWWNIFCENVHSQLSPVMARSTLAPIWHRFTPSLPNTSATSYPIYDDSSHNYSFRSEQQLIINEYNYEYDDDNYDKNPVDFSEFNDPWDQYISKSTPMENIGFYQQEDCALQYYNNEIQTEEKQYDAFNQQLNYQSEMTNRVNEYHRSQVLVHNQVDGNLNQNENQINLESEAPHHDLKYSLNDNVTHEKHYENFPTVNECFGSIEDCENNENHEIYENDKNHRLQDSFVSYNDNLQEESQTEYHFENRNAEQINDRLHGEFVSDNKQVNNIVDDSIAKDCGQTDHPKHSFSKSPSPEPCTDPQHNVAHYNEQSVNNQGQLDTEDAGIAGALAKMTLGEPRSSEQVALEEHMRRQGWEQGQIDYMGRDSFENIWKKICNTLNQAQPQEEPSPPKEELQKPTAETESSNVSEATPGAVTSQTAATETETEKVLTELAIPSENPVAQLLQSEETQASTPEVIDTPSKQEQKIEIEAEAKVESAVIEHQPEEKKTLIAEKILPETNIVSEETIGPQTTDIVEAQVNVENTQSTEVPQLPEKPEEISVSSEETTAPQTTDNVKAQVDVENTQSTEVPQLPENLKEEISVSISAEVITKALDAAVTLEAVSSEAKEDQSASTLEVATGTESVTEKVDESIKVANKLSELILDTSSVPIQVAESVLQAEPKESVFEDQSPVGEELVSSVVAPVLESVTAVSETVAESREQENVKMNGEAAGSQEIKNGYAAEIQPQSLDTQIDSVPKEIEQEVQVLEPEAKEGTQVDSVPEEIVQETQVSEPEIKESVQIAEEKPKAEAEEEPLSAISESSKSASPTPPDSPSTQGPVRPARTKDPKIPTTPIVTEATPPNSPPIGTSQSLEDAPKTVKKVVKKITKKIPAGETESTVGAEGEITEKKVVKKVIKKVVKKPTEVAGDAAEASGATAAGGEKPKRVVKIVKKIVKPTDSLDVDTSVPETPPVGVPVPPKRKTKTTTTKVTTTTTKTVPADEDKPSES